MDLQTQVHRLENRVKELEESLNNLRYIVETLNPDQRKRTVAAEGLTESEDRIRRQLWAISFHQDKMKQGPPEFWKTKLTRERAMYFFETGVVNFFRGPREEFVTLLDKLETLGKLAKSTGVVPTLTQDPGQWWDQGEPPDDLGSRMEIKRPRDHEDAVSSFSLSDLPWDREYEEPG